MKMEETSECDDDGLQSVTVSESKLETDEVEQFISFSKIVPVVKCTDEFAKTKEHLEMKDKNEGGIYGGEKHEKKSDVFAPVSESVSDHSNLDGKSRCWNLAEGASRKPDNWEPFISECVDADDEELEDQKTACRSGFSDEANSKLEPTVKKEMDKMVEGSPVNSSTTNLISEVGESSKANTKASSAESACPFCGGSCNTELPSLCKSLKCVEDTDSKVVFYTCCVCDTTFETIKEFQSHSRNHNIRRVNGLKDESTMSKDENEDEKHVKEVERHNEIVDEDCGRCMAIGCGGEADQGSPPIGDAGGEVRGKGEDGGGDAVGEAGGTKDTGIGGAAGGVGGGYGSAGDGPEGGRGGGQGGNAGGSGDDDDEDDDNGDDDGDSEGDDDANPGVGGGGGNGNVVASAGICDSGLSVDRDKRVYVNSRSDSGGGSAEGCAPEEKNIGARGESECDPIKIRGVDVENELGELHLEVSAGEVGSDPQDMKKKLGMNVSVRDGQDEEVVDQVNDFSEQCNIDQVALLEKHTSERSETEISVALRQTLNENKVEKGIEAEECASIEQEPILVEKDGANKILEPSPNAEYSTSSLNDGKEIETTNSMVKTELSEANKDVPELCDKEGKYVQELSPNVENSITSSLRDEKEMEETQNSVVKIEESEENLDVPELYDKEKTQNSLMKIEEREKNLDVPELCDEDKTQNSLMKIEESEKNQDVSEFCDEEKTQNSLMKIEESEKNQDVSELCDEEDKDVRKLSPNAKNSTSSSLHDGKEMEETYNSEVNIEESETNQEFPELGDVEHKDVQELSPSVKYATTSSLNDGKEMEEIQNSGVDIDEKGTNQEVPKCDNIVNVQCMDDSSQSIEDKNMTCFRNDRDDVTVNVELNHSSSDVVSPPKIENDVRSTNKLENSKEDGRFTNHSHNNQAANSNISEHDNSASCSGRTLNVTEVDDDLQSAKNSIVENELEHCENKNNECIGNDCIDSFSNNGLIMDSEREANRSIRADISTNRRSSINSILNCDNEKKCSSPDGVLLEKGSNKSDVIQSMKPESINYSVQISLKLETFDEFNSDLNIYANLNDEVEEDCGNVLDKVLKAVCDVSCTEKDNNGFVNITDPVPKLQDSSNGSEEIKCELEEDTIMDMICNERCSVSAPKNNVPGRSTNDSASLIESGNISGRFTYNSIEPDCSEESQGILSKKDAIPHDSEPFHEAIDIPEGKKSDSSENFPSSGPKLDGSSIGEAIDDESSASKHSTNSSNREHGSNDPKRDAIDSVCDLNNSSNAVHQSDSSKHTSDNLDAIAIEDEIKSSEKLVVVAKTTSAENSDSLDIKDSIELEPDIIDSNLADSNKSPTECLISSNKLLGNDQYAVDSRQEVVKSTGSEEKIVCDQPLKHEKEVKVSYIKENLNENERSEEKKDGLETVKDGACSSNNLECADNNPLMKTEESGEDLRQPIVKLEKLQPPLVERTSVSLAICELCGGACPTQQCLRLRRNSNSCNKERVAKRGRPRRRSSESRLSESSSSTETSSYTCLLCRQIMPDRESSLKHVQTSHDIICSTCGGVFHDIQALNDHRANDECTNKNSEPNVAAQHEDDDDNDNNKDSDASECKLPKRASKSFDFLGTLFASDNDEDSTTDDEDSDFTCDDNEIAEAEKEEFLDTKISDSRKKSLRSCRTRQGKLDESLTNSRRSFNHQYRVNKNFSGFHRSKYMLNSSRECNFGSANSSKKNNLQPLRIQRNSVLDLNGKVTILCNSKIVLGSSSNEQSQLHGVSSKSMAENSSSCNTDTISLRSGNSISRGDSCVSFKSNNRVANSKDDIKSHDEDGDDVSTSSHIGNNSLCSELSGRVKCDHCGSTYSTKSNLQRHIANHCRALNGVDKDSRKKKADDLKRKKLRKYYNAGCIKRGRRSFGGSSSFDEESESSDNDYSDEGCHSKKQRDKGTSTTGLVYSPRLILHRIDNGKVDSINSGEIKPNNDENINISETDKSIQVGQGECNIKNTKNFRCSDCRRSFYTQDDLSLHGMIHTNRTNFPCPRCNKVFPTFPNLRVHMRTHATGPPCLCDVCGKAFNTPSSLKVHMKTHDDDEKFNCSYCNRTFNFVGNLKVHERLHTGEKPYKCSLCERCFTQSTSLKLHVQSLHMQQRIPLPCDKCCRKFRTKETLERHKLCHVDYRRFKCDICQSVSFNNRAGLKHHMETKHSCIPESGEGIICNKLIDSNIRLSEIKDHKLPEKDSQYAVDKLPSFDVLSARSSMNTPSGHQINPGINILQNSVEGVRLNPEFGQGQSNEKNSNIGSHLLSAEGKNMSSSQNQFCKNGHNLSSSQRECSDYCKVNSVIDQAGFNMVSSAGSNNLPVMSSFNNSTPLKDRLNDDYSDLSTVKIGDNVDNSTINKTGFGDISPIGSSAAHSVRHIRGMGRGRSPRGMRRGSLNFQNFPPHKCELCAARFDKKVALRRHIKETHSAPFEDVNETLLQLQNDLEDLQRIYGNNKIDGNNQRGGKKKQIVELRKQEFGAHSDKLDDVCSSFEDNPNKPNDPQYGSEGSQNNKYEDVQLDRKQNSSFNSSFNVDSILNKSSGDADLRAVGESSVESGDGCSSQPNLTVMLSKCTNLDDGLSIENCNEFENSIDESGRSSGKSKTKYEFGCHLCDKSFPTTMGLVRHKNFVHKVPSERCRLPMRDKPFECEYCTKRFTFETGAQKHIQRHIEKGHSKRIKKEKNTRKLSVNASNYPISSVVNTSSYSAPPSVETSWPPASVTSSQHCPVNPVRVLTHSQADSRADLSDLNRPTSLPSFKCYDYRISSDMGHGPPVNHSENGAMNVNQNHVYDAYHNAWNPVNNRDPKETMYKNHIYPVNNCSTLQNEFGFVGNEHFNKHLNVPHSVYNHNNSGIYHGATSYSDGTSNKTNTFNGPTNYHDMNNTSYAQTSQAQMNSIPLNVPNEFIPKLPTDNDYHFGGNPYVGSNHQPYSAEKTLPETGPMYNSNHGGNYFKPESDYNNVQASYDVKNTSTYEAKPTPSLGNDQFMFNNASDDSSYMKNAYHAHALDASNYEKTYYNLDSNKFKNDNAYSQPSPAPESYSLTRLDGYATPPTPSASASKPSSPRYYENAAQAQPQPQSQPQTQPLASTGSKEQEFLNYYKSYQCNDMQAGQPYEKFDRTDINNDRGFGVNEWGGMMYNL